MKRMYLGFALSDSMFSGNVVARRRPIESVESVKMWIRNVGVTVVANPSHAPTFRALRRRFGLDIEPPERAPRVTLAEGWMDRNYNVVIIRAGRSMPIRLPRNNRRSVRPGLPGLRVPARLRCAGAGSSPCWRQAS